MFQRWRQKLEWSPNAAREIRRHGILCSIERTPTVARFVFQLSGDFSHEDTEEICQETFLSVVRNLSSFQGRSSFQTWLLRIAANKAMDYREKTRAAKRGGNAVHISIDAGRTDDEPPIDPPSGNPGPDTLLEIAETSRLVRESLDGLGEPCGKSSNCGTSVT